MVSDPPEQVYPIMIVRYCRVLKLGLPVAGSVNSTNSSQVAQAVLNTRLSSSGRLFGKEGFASWLFGFQGGVCAGNGELGQLGAKTGNYGAGIAGRRNR